MTWEWKIGDPVDDATGGSMDAMNWGHGSDDEDNDNDSRNYSGNNDYANYRPNISPEEINRSRLRSKMNIYESKLKKARNQTSDEYRIKYYLEALEYGRQYFEQSEKLGVAVDGMPDRDNLLSNNDIEWISQKHYDKFYKLHILSTDQTENLERLLKESGNGNIIKRNRDIREANFKESARKDGIDRAKYLNEDYFKYIEKANDLALKNKPRHAIKQYQKAISTYEKFFQSRYVKEGMVRKMPEKSLTPDAVDHIMIIYIKTHPILKSNAVNEKINGEILDMLGGDWDERLGEADREVSKILEQKNLEKQRRRKKAEGIAVDVIVGARIVADTIVNRLKR